MKTDYSELKGKEVNWTYCDGKEVLGFVVGATYRKGITIVKYEDETKFLLCLNYNGTYMPGNKTYREMFYYLIKQIRNGQVSYKDVLNFSKVKDHQNPDYSNCAFNKG